MEDKSNLRKIYEAIRGGIGSPMSGLGPTQEYMRDILKPEGFDERQAQADMSIREMFEIEFKRARERGDEVFEFMGKPYNTKTKEEVQGFSSGDSVYGPKALVPGGGIPSMVIDTPNISTGQDIDFSDVFDKDALDEAQEDLNEFDLDELEVNVQEGGIDAETRNPKEIAKIIKNKKTPKEKMEILGEMLEMVGASNDFSPLVSSQIIKGSQASIPQLQRYNGGGLANLNYNLDFDINDYLENILGVDTGEGTEEDMATALARAYGAPSEGIGAYARSMGYRDTTPGAGISINAKDTTPDVYRFYPSEVSKIYSQAKGTPFSPLVAPPREATFVDDLQPRRIASQLYAKDGTYVQGYADGTGSMGAIPKYPYGNPSEAVENLHDRKRDINDIIEEGYYIDREQKDVIYLDDNPKAFKALLNELNMIDKELQMTRGMGGNTRRMNEANQTMGNVIRDLRGYADGTGSMGVEDYPRRQELITGPGGERGDEIPAMLSDGEFVTNSAAVRGMGIAAGADPQDEYEQRLLGAREMYKMQKFGEEIAQQLV